MTVRRGFGLAASDRQKDITSFEAVDAPLVCLEQRGCDRGRFQSLERGLQALIVARARAAADEGQDFIGRRRHEPIRVALESVLSERAFHCARSEPDDSAVIAIAGRFRIELAEGAGMQRYLNLKGYGEFDGAHRPSGWNAWLTLSISPVAPAVPVANKN